MITDYLNIDLTKELGLDKLPEDQKKSLEIKMAEVLENRIMNALFIALSEEDRAELEKKLDADDDNIIEFLKEKIDNFEILVAEEVANFKKDAVALNESIKEQRKDQ